jgi:FKBP-type peptidyl-prolyl cis-trans isomerase FkpA
MRKLLVLLPTLLMAQSTVPNPPANSSKPAARSSAPAKPASVKRATPPAPVAPAKLTPMTDNDKIVYALGLSIYQSLGQFNLSPGELELVKQAITDSAAKQPAEDLATWGPRIQSFAQERAARAAEQQKVDSNAYLEKAAAEPGAVKTPSGLVYKEVQPGTGPSPTASDTVRVNYRGTLVNGTEFDSSYKRNEPAEFPLTGVIPCWTEGLQKMKVGGKAILSCPSSLAYGDQGRPSIPGGAALIFEIDLLDIVNPAGAPPAQPGQPRPQ